MQSNCSLQDLDVKRPRRKSQLGESKRRQLVPGQCFGEEILLGFEEFYDYTVTSTEESKMEMIQQAEFIRVFQMMPNILERIRKNALLINPDWADKDDTAASQELSKARPSRQNSRNS